MTHTGERENGAVSGRLPDNLGEMAYIHNNGKIKLAQLVQHWSEALLVKARAGT